MARRTPRTQACTPAEARLRQEQARRFLDVAELVADERDPDVEYAGVAASLAVLAGIASSDAACCHVLGERSRSHNHRDAEQLLAEIRPGGNRAATSLRELLNVKDSAHYGLMSVTSAELKRAMRQARRLLDFADEVLRR